MQHLKTPLLKLVQFDPTARSTEPEPGGERCGGGLDPCGERRGSGSDPFLLIGVVAVLGSLSPPRRGSDAWIRSSSLASLAHGSSPSATRCLDPFLFLG